MEIWQFRVKSFRRMVRGWANNVVAEMNKYKKIVAAEFKHLTLRHKTGCWIGMRDLG
jgi:hypothetical protein